MTDQRTTPSPESTSPKHAEVQGEVQAQGAKVQAMGAKVQAEMQADAENAHRKATRPWFGKKRFILLAVILPFVIIKASAGSGDKGTSDPARSGPQSNVASAPEAKPAGAWIGTRVRDGEFEFVVTSMQRLGRTLASQSGMTKTAQASS